MDGWLASGMTRAAFARSVGVQPSTLGWWHWKLRRPVEPMSFADVVVDPSPSARPTDFVVELGDLRVRVSPGFDAGELRRLVEALC